MSLEEKLNWKNTFNSFIPTTIAGCITMGYTQHITFENTNSLSLAIASGLTAQSAVRSGVIVLAHAYLSKPRLKKKETGSFSYGIYTQEMVSIASASKVLYWPYLASVTGISSYMVSQDYNNFLSGSVSSASAGIVYALALSFFSPNINRGIDFVKEFTKKKINNYFRK